MSDTSNSSDQYQPDSQSQRWLKYGTNVALASLIVIALAVGVIYLAEWKPKQWDTTANSQYSLKPQSVKLIEANKQKIKIVNLYTRSKPPEQDQTASTDKTTVADLDKQATTVDDLLDEYRSRGKNITVESIDPIKDPAKVDALINEVSDQFSGQVAAYKKFTDDLKPAYDSIEKLAEGEVAKIDALPRKNLNSQTANESFSLAFLSVSQLPDRLKEREAAFRKAMRERIPNYKAITDDVDQTMPDISSLLGFIIEGFTKTQTDNAVPAEFRKYATDNLPVYVSMKKQIDDLVAREKGLGELKLDTLKTALAQRNPILVRGETAWKVIPYDQVWQNQTRENRDRPDDAKTGPLFAGEQAITTAVLALTEPVKPKVCFVRAGGQPVASDGGVFNTVADRLRLYNYDVTDKDLTGQYAAMAAQQQQMPVSEPSDADIADAIWVVNGEQQRQQQMMQQPPQGIGQAVADHIAHGFHYVNGVKTPGGVAMILLTIHGESFSDVLSPLGVTARPDAMVEHALVPREPNSSDDIDNQARSAPFAFLVTDWGTSEITTPIQSLPGVLIGTVMMRSQPVAGVTTTPLIPVISEQPVFAQTDEATFMNPKDTKDKELAAPFNAGYALENTKAGSRVIVVGSLQTFRGGGEFGGPGPVDWRDEAASERGTPRLAFPGDSEFFMNSIYWLGHRESMIAMSPAAMTVDRIGPMSNGILGFWHIGILLLGIPGLAVAVGAAVFYARRG